MDTTELNYEEYDRLLHTLISMSHLLVNAWDDYSTTEMTLDIKSLNIKASRLFYMADADWSLQQQDMVHLRKQKNEELMVQMEFLINERITPLMKHVVKQIRETQGLQGKKTVSFPHGLTEIMPRLIEVMMHENMEANKWNEVLGSTLEIDKLLRKKLKIVTFPGMDFRQRFWMLYEYYVLMCYLLYHFHRVCALSKSEITGVDAGLKLQQIIQLYVDSQDGSKELMRYWNVLLFNNDGQPLEEDALRKARKDLLQKVPVHLQLCFIQHINNLDDLAEALQEQDLQAKDYLDFVAVLAKWQMITRQIEQLLHPEQAIPVLYNKVFHTLLHNKAVDMMNLRNRIERMLPLIKHKNDWFCVWSVLNHFNLLKTKNFEAFAQQMMHPDWFGGMEGVLQFTGDTLREYTGYFTEVHYTVWNTKQYLLYKAAHGKKKWADSLCDKFLRLCLELEEILQGE